MPLEQVDKATWVARCTGPASWSLRYRVYAFELSVRAAFLDADRGFFNGTGLCLRVEGREGEPHRLALAGLAPGWQVATTLAPEKGGAAHEFVAADYDELVDHPVELGRFWRGSFSAAGIAHEFVVAGALPDFDGETLLADTKRICETAVAFWHGPGGKAPFDRYLFLLNARRRGPRRARASRQHGTGRAAPASAAARRSCPRRPHRGRRGGVAGQPAEGYTDLLGLISHEYFHAWSVKRLKPRDFARLDYARENYTRLLWFFEGFTSYYDDLLLRRSGLIDAAHYLQLVAKTMTARRRHARPRVAERRRVELRCLGQVLPRRREHAERHRQLLRQGRAGRARLRPDAAQRGPRLARRRHAPPLGRKRGRADRRRRHRRGARGGRRSLVRGRARGLGARHRRAAAGRAAAALRRRRRAPAGDAGAAARRARQRERADRGEGHARAARRRRRADRPGRRRRADRRRRLAAASSRRRAPLRRAGRCHAALHRPRSASARPALRPRPARRRRERPGAAAPRRRRQPEARRLGEAWISG